MTLNDLIRQARTLSDDLREPYRVSRANWVIYANEAQEEACRRARLIMDSTTAEICQVALADATATYALDSRILFVRRVKLTGQSIPLKRVSHKTLDRFRPGWEDETGMPEAYVPDMDTGLLRPYPTPDGAYTANLLVVRLPLVSMADGDNVPEIRGSAHKTLVDWMLHRAYSVVDSELYNPKKADMHLAVFEQEFGRKSSTQDESWIEREHGYEEDEGIY